MCLFTHTPALRPGRFGRKVGQIGTKWDKYGTLRSVFCAKMNRNLILNTNSSIFLYILCQSHTIKRPKLTSLGRWNGRETWKSGVSYLDKIRTDLDLPNFLRTHWSIVLLRGSTNESDKFSDPNLWLFGPIITQAGTPCGHCSSTFCDLYSLSLYRLTH